MKIIRRDLLFFDERQQGPGRVRAEVDNDGQRAFNPNQNEPRVGNDFVVCEEPGYKVWGYERGVD